MSLKRTEIATLLRQRFFSALHLGLLGPGARLPSARELAVELGIDRRVVLNAYHELEREGLVELRQRSGIFFSHRVRGMATGVLAPSAEWAVDVLARALAQGIPAPQFGDRFQSYISTLRLRAVCLECNSDQRTALAYELASDYGFEARSLDIDELLAEPTPRADLRRADLLVTTPFHAGEVRELAARANKPWLAISFGTDIFAEIARLLPRQPVYFVVLDPRYAVKLRRIFSNVSGGANFHALVQGRDDLTLVPDTAPVYITQAARAQTNGEIPAIARLLERVMPEERQFSAGSARELLSFVVHANMAAIAAKE